MIRCTCCRVPPRAGAGPAAGGGRAAATIAPRICQRALVNPSPATNRSPAFRSRLFTPRHLSTDHDPVFEAHRWTANLRILEIDEIKTVPHVPLSHPFVERLIGTTRREFLDQV